MYVLLFWASEFLTVALIIAPVLVFLANGWHLRRQEFVNNFTADALALYLKKFWGEELAARLDEEGAKSSTIFRNLVFDKVLGRRLYVIPLLLLLLALLICCGLVIETAMRTSIEHYYIFYLDWQKAEPTLVTGLQHVELGKLDDIFHPFPRIVLDLQALAALAGAYLYVSGAIIQASRARTLVASDLYWSAVRLVIAIPMGLSLAQLANSTIAAFIAFGLGAFPIEAITRLLRRLLNRSLNAAEQKAEDEDSSDQLVQLIGVTPQISAVLNGEGIDSVQQLAETDPVSFAVRTGLPFDYVLALASQSQAWCYLSSSVKALQSMGLGDARPLARLMTKWHAEPGNAELNQVIDAAAQATKTDRQALIQAFDAIAADNYTKFLLQMSDGAGQ